MFIEKREDRFASSIGKQIERNMGAVRHSAIPGMRPLLMGSRMQIANTGGRNVWG